ncbi:amidohydrolase family protein [Nocardioides sp. CER19]|uniref:amidohydrolase family protein n=1 Tax=Nocardioides sp. CER19 TaxID=3038538 RepID=UPI00244A12C3|nr:amidohydrolase family protein [Nocardioides sp. CER19]MDH2412903.1 amidohydrolase family protein [Nocardioides sp. CER19]
MLILRGGRVVDPRSGTEQVGDVAVEGGRVVAVGPSLAHPGATEVDVSGLVVGPGFVDLHSHVHSIAGQRLQALDGVTATLDLEAGLMPVEKAYARAAADGRPLHYGFSASWGDARAAVHLGVTPDADLQASLVMLGDPAWQRTSSPSERAAWLRLLEAELEAGALGIGVLMGYAPRSDPDEFLDVARLAARTGTATFTHVREIVEADPTTPIDGSLEITRAAAETGAAMHHCHVNSTSRRHVDRVLGLLDTARSNGSRVTVEAYPYGAGSTAIGAFFLAPERLAAWGLTPSSLTMVATGERIASVARLAELRAADPGAVCVVAFLDEEDPEDAALLQRSLSFPDSIVASDAMHVEWSDGSTDSREWPLPPGGQTHPRTAGTFARSLRRMVLETGAWSWAEAFRRCSYLPAQVVAGFAPSARGKGWVGAGSDADLVVLDPRTISDSATYVDPTRPSVGVRHLLVDGTFVVRDGALDPEAFPGRPIRASLS